MNAPLNITSMAFYLVSFFVEIQLPITFTAIIAKAKR